MDYREDANLHKYSNNRKREVYWVGFLDGILSSTKIETGETNALLSEAVKFIEFFDDPDAADLIADLKAECFSCEHDLMSLLSDIITEKRRQLTSQSPYSEKDEVNEFLGFAAGIICDGIVLEQEAKSILDRFQKSNVLNQSPVFSDLRRALTNALSDKLLTSAEAAELKEWLSCLVGGGYSDTGLPNIGNTSQLDGPITDPDLVSLNGSVFVLTGPMKLGPRSFIVKEIERCGGAVGKNTTQKTDYVVISSTASKNWRTTHFGTKIEKAKTLIEQGANIRFVTEYALGKAISNCGNT